MTDQRLAVFLPGLAAVLARGVVEWRSGVTQSELPEWVGPVSGLTQSDTSPASSNTITCNILTLSLSHSSQSPSHHHQDTTYSYTPAPGYTGYTVKHEIHGD